MAKKLKDLVITKVALVPKGSNPDADIALFKADPVAKMTFNEILEGQPQNVREALWKIYDLTYTLNTAVSYSFYGKKAVEDVRKSIDQFKAAVDEVLNEISTTKAVAADVDVLKAAVIAKTREFLAGHQQEDKVKKLEEMSKEELVAHATELQTKIDTPVAKADAAPPTPAEVIKNADLPEAVKKALEAQVAETVVIKAQLEATQAEVAKEKTARRLVEKTAFVAKELPNIPGKPEDIAKGLLESEDKLSKESYDMLVASMKAGSAAVAKTMAESGVEGVAAASGDAFGKLEGIAKESMKTDPKLTFEKAFSKACDDNAELYMEHRQEQKAAAKR